MKKKLALSIAILLLVAAGCAKEIIYSSSPPMKTVSTDLFEATLEPLKAEKYNYYNSFRFVFTNKTDKDLVVDWSGTFYLQDNRKYGRFAWKGLTFEQLRGLEEQPDLTVGGGSTITKVIFPLQLIGWKEQGVRMKSNTIEAGFTIGVIPPGENGMSLAVRQNGESIRKDILVNITQN